MVQKLQTLHCNWKFRCFDYEVKRNQSLTPIKLVTSSTEEDKCFFYNFSFEEFSDNLYNYKIEERMDIVLTHFKYGKKIIFSILQKALKQNFH